MSRYFSLLILFVAACGAPSSKSFIAVDPGGGLTGNVLETRIANTQMTVKQLGKPDVVVLRLKADRTMTSLINGKFAGNAVWQIKGNQLCTTDVVGGQAIPNTQECGSVAINDGSVTLRQTTSSTGGGDVLTGRIEPI